jgi:hypothetical protein
MEFLDFSPPALPSLAQQRDALRKGLGRAMQWAKAGCLADEVLLDACLHDKRFDTHLESIRGEWLKNIIKAAGAVGRFRNAVLQTLRSVPVERDAYQLCQLALHYAEAGDDEFGRCLYDIVAQRPIPACPWIGENEIFELGGKEAFGFIAHLRGTDLENRQWEWDDDAIVDRAIEKFGEGTVANFLGSSADPAIKRFESHWRQSRSSPQESLPSRAARVRSIPVAEIVSAAESDFAGISTLRIWGVCADDGELETVLECLWAAQDPKVIRNLLEIFWNRPPPRFDPRFVALCRSSDGDVQLAALNALARIAHPQVREFALTELENPTLEESVVMLFVKNFMQGDEQRLLDFVDLPKNTVKRHFVIFDLLDVLEENPDADASQLGVIAYYQTPSEISRFRAVNVLVGRSAAPGWLREECRDDSGEDCRALVRQAATGNGQCTG